ncbi:MAG: sigma-70 family RNA polymerase sigma factor [Isosphaeraceae bacterium]|nr:sigma-70 family RNA polymerase sigma factor [Isosphaeraceae bacterium]
MKLIAESTSVSLLARLSAGVDDQDAWARFICIYGPPVLDWCRRHGLQDADARDVAQDVMTEISKEIARDRYDPSRSFRGWLRAIAHAAWCNWTERRKPWHIGSGDTGTLAIMEGRPAHDELLVRIEAEYDLELLQTASRRVRERVETHTWEAFRLLAVEGLSGREAAERLGMKLGSVFAARSKVQRMLREEVESLDIAP